MSSDTFYSILGIDADSSPEDIRKAYKKRALQTHPDRLPQGATADDKRYAEEQFRKVNNAYEVLSDSSKRRVYDLYGTWPPPENLPDDRRTGSYDSSYHGRSQAHTQYPFNDPFFRTPFPLHSNPRFAFRDPFELFNSFFTEFNHDPFGGFSPFPSHFNRPNIFDSTFHPMTQSSLFGDPFGFRPSIGMSPGFTADPNNTRVYSFQSSSRSSASPGATGNRWVSESTSTRIINGITETIQKKIDEQGNEHVKRIYHDGREKYTINGVEQPSHGYIPDVRPAGQLPPPHPQENNGYIPPPQPDDVASSSRVDNRSKKHWWNRS